jgi:excisionase family DNA binding protein
MATEIEGLKFYTVIEASKALNITTQTTRKYIKQGRLKAVRVGRPLYITEKSLKEFLGE